jgi:hypothetical protein
VDINIIIVDVSSGYLNSNPSTAPPLPHLATKAAYYVFFIVISLLWSSLAIDNKDNFKLMIWEKELTLSSVKVGVRIGFGLGPGWVQVGGRK